MSALRFLFLTLLLAVDSVLSAEEQRITITAEAGQDSVTLPCEHGKKKINIIVLDWSRPDLDPDIVIFYSDGRFDPDQQNPSFRNRVDLQHRQMKDGDASLILKDLTINDTGTYECRVQTRSDSVPQLISTIHLVVSPPGTQEGGGKEARVGEEGGDEEGGGKEARVSLGLTVGLPVSLCVIVGVTAWIYFRKPACLQRFRLFSRQPPTETPKPPEPTEPEQPEPDETEMSLLSSPSEPPAAGPSSTSGTQTAASSPEHPAHPE